ncbi:MAG: restriction endonuclease [Bacteroidota bacterium]
MKISSVSSGSKLGVILNESYEDFHKIKESVETVNRGQIRYIAEIEHTGLRASKIFVDRYKWNLNYKIDDQFDKWDEIWLKSLKKHQIQSEKENSIAAAEEKTKESQEKIGFINDVLKNSIISANELKLEAFIDTRQFDVPNPKQRLQNELDKIKPPIKGTYKSLPLEPNKLSFEPRLDFFDKIFKSFADKKIKKADELFDKRMFQWNKEVLEIENSNKNVKEQYSRDLIVTEKKIATIKQKFDELEKSWQTQGDEYYLRQNEENLKIKNLIDLYNIKDAVAIVEYCEIVLTNSEYPESFPKEFDLEYNKENKFLILDYELPAPDDFPKLIEVKYLAIKKETKEIYLPENQFHKLYDTAIYNIVLKTLYELYQSDKIDALHSIVLNGWVKSINKATGKLTNSCIVSIQVKKEEFIDIDLLNVDPKICFKNLKGLGSSKLVGITAIQPIIQVNRNDKRFVSSYDVAQTLDEGYNLAAMGWEDFEHLIREIFEKEFSANGGEVKVTQASRDGGVDAIAYDPDPIRGGKIVIQAKRYTNTVGVSAIRDLYGTVLNEGATKGILVTTSDYGPDAYEFVKNKPLTLLSGNNLLYLLEKHGHKAKIDLLEAKRILKLDNTL